MSLKILNEEVDNGVLTIQLDNGDYKVLKEIVERWKFKDRENALRFALAILSDTENGTLSRKRDDGIHSLLVPTDEILEDKDASRGETAINDFRNDKFFSDIKDDLADLSSEIRQPDKFAQIFCEAASKQKSIDDALKKVVVDLLQKDVDAQQSISLIVEKVDRTYGRLLFGRIGFAIWTIALLVIGAVEK